MGGDQLFRFEPQIPNYLPKILINLTHTGHQTLTLISECSKLALDRSYYRVLVHANHHTH
ncbi:hypothetical protein SAMN03159338_4242 [Sphingomonas sp. NFR04]|nr:hypothetical protein SAMN03159338_4242 [Sphingomonas sp. NFR04]